MPITIMARVRTLSGLKSSHTPTTAAMKPESSISFWTRPFFSPAI